MQNRAKAATHNKLQMGNGRGKEKKKARNVSRMETEATEVSSQDQRDGALKSGLTRVPGPISNSNNQGTAMHPCPEQPPKGRPTAKGQSVPLALLVKVGVPLKRYKDILLCPLLIPHHLFTEEQC